MVSTICLSIIGFAIGAYFIYSLLLFLFQEKLIFQKIKPNLLSYKKLKPFTISLVTNDQITLYGWFITNNSLSEVNDTTLIYFGGNAQDVSTMLPILEQIQVNRAYTFNYRGYGLSTGKPSEASLYSDAIAIVNQIRKQHQSSNIILMGHSLGSAIAGYTANHTNPSKLILLCPLHSITKIATNRYYVPSFLINHKFSLAKTAKTIATPSLILLADNDSIIPANHSITTFNNLGNYKEFKKIPNSDHNDLFQNNETLTTINNFLVSDT